MDYLADSCDKLCQGRQDGYMVWQCVPMYDCSWEEQSISDDAVGKQLENDEKWVMLRHV